MEMNRNREGEQQVKEMEPKTNQERKGKSCIGTLYYSSHLKSKGRDPRCVGFTRSLQQVPKYNVSEFEVQASKEGRSLTEFKYACVGYSVYLDKSKDAPSNGDQKPLPELPGCVGIRLLVYKRPSDQPAPAHAPAHAHTHNREDERTHPQHQPPKTPHHMGEEFLTRFSRNAGLVASGVARNMRRVGVYVKESIDDILYRRPK